MLRLSESLILKHLKTLSYMGVKALWWQRSNTARLNCYDPVSEYQKFNFHFHFQQSDWNWYCALANNSFYSFYSFPSLHIPSMKSSKVWSFLAKYLLMFSGWYYIYLKKFTPDIYLSIFEIELLLSDQGLFISTVSNNHCCVVCYLYFKNYPALPDMVATMRNHFQLYTLDIT